MILQNIQFPTINNNRDTYFRAYKIDGRPAEFIFDNQRETIKVDKGVELNFNTYFNSFSYEKWNRYTSVKDVFITIRLKGCCEVVLTRLELNAKSNVEEYPLYSEWLKSFEQKEFTIKFPDTVAKGILTFKLRTLTSIEFYGGSYIAEIDEDTLPDVNLAVCICTYKRENYIAANMQMLRQGVFNANGNMLADHLRVYIADNGQTLNPNDFPDDAINVFPNLNGGGAAGFARCMIEVLNDREKYGITHVVLMDDDVVFTHHALERTYAFMRLIKPEYRDVILGGAMLKLNEPFIQHAAGETWGAKDIFFNKVDYNMYLVRDILLTELEESVNQLAWWYSCFSIDETLKNDLPIPIFFQYDDFDFNLRHGNRRKITTIGVCLWHESFEKKEGASKIYYTFRNRAIINALHGGKEFSKRWLKMLVAWHTLKNVMLYRYKTANLVLRACEDFFRGFEWLGSINPQELNTEIMNAAYQLEPIRDLPVNFAYKRFVAELEWHESKLKRLFRVLTLNGWFRRAKGEITISAVNPNHGLVYLKKRVLHYDLESQKGYVTEKNWAEFWAIIRRGVSAWIQIDSEFDKAVQKYRDSYPQYITEGFWRKYLELGNKE